MVIEKFKRNSEYRYIYIDTQRQVIKIIDNAGGIKKDDLHHIVGPGHSSNDSNESIIGIFGVGSKRAVVALSPHTIIKSRYKKQPTYSVEITDDWLKDENWKFPVYELSNINENSTEIEMTKIRDILTGQSIRDIKDHISAIYSKILINQYIELKLNGERIKPLHFDEEWSHNPDVSPKGFDLTTKVGGEKITVKITRGLIAEGGDSGYGEYGVYIYCNNRLIVRSLKTPEVGFSKGQVGVPHNSISLARVIIEIVGPAEQMPWNSSKSGVDIKHKVFQLIREKMIEVIKHYTSASRNLFPERETKIAPFKQGKINFEKIQSISEIEKSALPEIPSLKKRLPDKIKELNLSLAKSEPWIVGAYEVVVMAEVIKNKSFETKNRIILILLDSSIEIAFKDYLAYKVKSHFYTDAALSKIFDKRHLVHQEIQKYSSGILDHSDWNNLDYYYRLRCELVHKRASATVLDTDISRFSNLAKKIHKKLLGVKYPTLKN
ncbi:ATP-binding protein [Leptospira borgpetersenii]|uniref:Phage-related protein n=2 Tax=Leptospira borgpetersenii serovar Hardjo-bovis TaxID=338217 RepID=Q04NQ4_LEPBJ|nr:ATP-binding protein [Leptospira borgpetersenii]ABJ77466.1 Phage-related protein [Leptospira borgpetersenii serovar Hardjo-bovis str. JB197]ABJ80403.1 Phage-related protein [Leptospira borgpetersenii serovar Hardjo-bovis str. L550]AMX59846.1 hypothetical protein LBK6_16440 [Leptospira borgpetersenii serovar Hardjo]AMX63075.1 hypothetical protein LBK9_16370 [Leptospira borgpetersenii serovar Hardjo]AMX66318.1 hypothetical protein LBK30_16360 [Leptospira borgpetersenii serovar Hardjo]